MERDFYKFNHREKIAFDKAYPSKEIEKFINGGGDDPVEIFDALKTFDFPNVRPDTKNIVIAHFSESRFAPQINMQDGKNGTVMIYRSNIVPLLRASLDVFWQVFDLFTNETKKGLDSALSSARKIEEEWQK